MAFLTWISVRSSRQVEEGLLKNDFIYLFRLCWVFVAVIGLYLVAESRGYFLVTVHGPLIVAASLLGEQGSRVSRLRYLWHRCSGVSAPGL